MTRTEAEAALGEPLPHLTPPVANYVVAKRVGDAIYVSGQLPMRDGKLTLTGPVTDVEAAKSAARICALNAVAAAFSVSDEVNGVVRVGVFVQCGPGFTGQPAVANGASDVLVQGFGERGRHVRAAVGSVALPLDAAVEVEVVFQA